jgi:hypothetical protein
MKNALTLMALAVWPLIVFTGVKLASAVYKRRKPHTSTMELLRLDATIQFLKKDIIQVPVAAACGILSGFLTIHSAEIIRRMVLIMGLRWVQLIVAIVVLTLGGLAYYFKRVSQLRYGLVEIGFGVVGSYIALKQIDEQHFFPTLATLCASIYVVARGFGNAFEGQETRDRQTNRR